MKRRYGQRVGWIQGVLGSAALAMVVVAGPVDAKEKAGTKVQATPGGAGRDDPRAEDERLAKDVKKIVVAYARGAGVESRERETIAAMAAVVGERCQEVAAEFPVRKHTFVPGQRVFSDKINVLLAGDGRTLDPKAISGATVYGQLRDEVDGTRFSEAPFPELVGIFQGFAGRIGKPEDWGRVPLSLPRDAWPHLLPLRVNFDTRGRIDEIARAHACRAYKAKKSRCVIA